MGGHVAGLHALSGPRQSRSNAVGDERRAIGSPTRMSRSSLSDYGPLLAY